MGRSKLLDVAVREFGRKGLEGASTRGIAAAAGTAMSSITYHYRSKEGLYAAAAEHIDRQLAEEMAPFLPAGPVPGEAAEARAELHRLLDALAVKMIGDAEADRSLFIMREQMDFTGAFDFFDAGTMGRMAKRLVELVRSASGAAERDARIAAVSLFGQVVVWRASRALADRVLGSSADAGCGAAIREAMARNADCILDRLATNQQEPS